ncbi:general secretion pathway protein D [Salinisphaera sp. T5B8]
MFLLIAAVPAFAQNARSAEAAVATNTANAEGASLNFEKADINAVIAAVSNITGRNFIVDPRVRGEVTVFTPSSVDERAVYQTFLAILDVLGYAAVPTATAVQIVPEGEAKQYGEPAEVRGQTDSDVVTRTIELENVDASELVGILRPLMPQDAQIAVYPAGNTLIITDRRANIQRLQRIIASLDQRKTTALDIVKLQYAEATEVVNALNQIQQSQGPSGARAALPIVADPRSNQIILGGDTPTNERLRNLIGRLDVDISSGDATTEVLYLQNAEAESVAPLLQQLAQIESQRYQTSERGSNVNNAVGVFADTSLNAIVVTAPEQTIEAIRQLLKKIDIRRAQILVEAVIAEVSDTKTRELGVDIAALGDNVAFASLLDPATISAIGSGGVNGGTINPAAFAGRGGSLGAINRSGDSAIAGLIRALATDQNTNILSAPTLVTMDNEEAKISVGQEVPFLTGSFTTAVSGDGDGGGAVNPFQTIERRDVGLTLTITPQISQGDTVKLQISQEISSISGTQADAVDLITNKRTLSNTVAVDDGRVLVLGGLIDQEFQGSESKVPLLGDIPLIGVLFRRQAVTNRKRNLMIFIRPVIIRDADTASAYTKEKYRSAVAAQEHGFANNESVLGSDDRIRLNQPSSGAGYESNLLTEGSLPVAESKKNKPLVQSTLDYAITRSPRRVLQRRPRQPWPAVYRILEFQGCLDHPPLSLTKPSTPTSRDAAVCRVFDTSP